MTDPAPKDKADASVSESTRNCSACGQSFSGPFHSPCPMESKTVKDSSSPPPAPPSTKRAFDQLPDEAAACADDPTLQLHQYILVRQIGQGGMGTVWKAWDRKLTRWVAIKFLLAGAKEGIDRFEREARLAARIRHPNIAAIHEVGEAPSRQPGQSVAHYLVMEFIDGQTLASTTLSRREFVEIFLKIARAVDVAHRGGVIHRDLKPLNIMVTREQWPYVMDFGLAKSFETDSSLSNSGSVMGTPAYMPPEQAEGRLSDIDARSDIYSLGATMYSVLLGRPPFPGQSTFEIIRRVLNDPLMPPRQIQPDFPPDLEAILLRAMARAPAERYQTAAALADDLARHLEGTRAPAPPPSEGRSAAPPKKRFPILPLLAAAALGGLGVAYVVRPPPTPPPEPKEQVPIRRPVRFPETEPPNRVFALRVAIHPFAEVVRVTCDGEPVKFENRMTPLLEAGLKMGTYSIVLRHPQLGERTVEIPQNTLSPGKTYAVWGRMENPELRVSESP